MSKIEIGFDLDNVINMLKGFVNEQCEKGFKWYPEVPEKVKVGIWDFTRAIDILEEAKKAGQGKGSVVVDFNKDE